jgi:hypothetical protein
MQEITPCSGGIRGCKANDIRIYQVYMKLVILALLVSVCAGFRRTQQTDFKLPDVTGQIDNGNANLLAAGLSEDAMSHKELERAALEDRRATSLVRRAKALSLKIAKLRSMRSAPSVSSKALSWAMRDLSRSLNQVEGRRLVRFGSLHGNDYGRFGHPRHPPHLRSKIARSALDSKLHDRTPELPESSHILEQDAELAKDDGIIAGSLSAWLSHHQTLASTLAPSAPQPRSVLAPRNEQKMASAEQADDDIHVRVEGGCHSQCAPKCCSSEGSLVNLITSIVSKEIGTPGLNGINGIPGSAGPAGPPGPPGPPGPAVQVPPPIPASAI